MKKISIIMMALALVMGMSQCKKNEQEASNNGDNTAITLRISSNSKLHFGEETAMGRIPVLWHSQDIVYMGVNGKCIGYLYCTGSAQDEGCFSGNANTIDVNDIPVGEYMDFFTLGAQVQTIETGTIDQVTFSYADQSVDPAVVSFGTSRERWTGIKVDVYHCDNFRNYNALVKFTLNRPTADEITIQGVKNQMVIKFDGTFENVDAEGDIITFQDLWEMLPGTATNVRYAVVPNNQGIVTNGTVLVNGNPAGTFTIPEKADRDKLIKGTITLD